MCGGGGGGGYGLNEVGSYVLCAPCVPSARTNGFDLDLQCHQLVNVYCV